MLDLAPVQSIPETLGPEAGPVRIRHPDGTVTLSCRPAAQFQNRWLRLEAAFPPAGLVEVILEVRSRHSAPLFFQPTLVGRNHFSGRFRSAQPIDQILLHLSGSGALDRPIHLQISPAPRWPGVVHLARRALQVLWNEPVTLVGRAIQYLSLLRHGGSVLASGRGPAVSPPDAYRRWIELFDEHPLRDQSRHAARLNRLSARPLISILLPARLEEPSLALLIEDLERQIYPAWELVVGGGGELVGAHHSRTGREPPGNGRIRFVEAQSGDRAALLNATLQAASGEFVIPLPAGAHLRPHALLELALAADLHPTAHLFYADEDSIDGEGQRQAPKFKPAWSPDLLASHDYMGHPAWFRTRSLKEIGGWRPGLDGAEDHDLKLRFTHSVKPQEIVHIAKVLLHQGESGKSGATANEASGGMQAQLRVISDHLERQRIQAEVVADPRSPHPRIVHAAEDPPLVSLLIPTRDNARLLDACVTSIIQRTRYPRFEIIVIDHESQSPETLRLFESWARDHRIRIMRYEGPFNYSDINNRAARIARGSILGLVNNDIEVMSEDWLNEMVGYAVRPHVGCVGAKLYYGNDTIQHAGIVLGLGGGAGHGHKLAPRHDRGYLDQLASVRNVSAVTAACLLVRTKVFWEVGGLDAHAFAVAFNDVDFCLKVAAAGYSNVWTPFAELYHHESVSRGLDVTPAKAQRFAKEVRSLRERWGRWLLSDPYYSPHLSAESEDYGLRLR